MLAPVFFITGCGRGPEKTDSAYHIVDVTGASIVLNYLKSSQEFYPIQTDENDTLTIAVSEGDLLYILFDDMESLIFYRYDPDDGSQLSFSYDTGNQICYLNDVVISLDLSEGSRSWSWIEQHNEELLKRIRSLNVKLPLPDAQLNMLSGFAEVNSDPGLYISGDSLAAGLLSLFHPEWLFAEDILFDTLPDSVRQNLDDTEVLLYDCYNASDMNFLQDLQHLRSLALIDCDSGSLQKLDLEGLEMLRSLCLIESDFRDLSSVGILPDLEDLDFVDCDDLEGIGSLEGYHGLKSLGFYDCGKLKDVGVLHDLPALSRLALPGQISQEEFADIIMAQPSLQMVELLSTPGISDLSPLAACPGLKALYLDLDSVDLAPLYDMKELGLIVLGQDYFEDSAAMETIRTALPGTRIVPGGTFCLGSGWLLLLLPAAILIIIARKRKSLIRSG